MKITTKLAVFGLWWLLGGWAFAQPAQTTPLAFNSLMTDIASAAGQVIAVGEQGHILFSQDSGQSWEQGRVPVDNLLTSVSMLDKNHAWAVGHDGVVLKTEDGGRNWQLLFSLFDETNADFVDPLLDVLFWDHQNGIAVGAFGQYYRTDDGGKSWSNQSNALPNEDELHLNAVLRTPEQELWIASEYGIAFRSTDGGNHWESVQFPSDGTFFALAYQPHNRAVVVAGITGSAFTFELGFNGITPIPLKTSQSLYDVLITDSQRHLVGANGVWQRGNVLRMDQNRLSRHAITQPTKGIFAMATVQGVQVVNGDGDPISFRFIGKEDM